MKFSDTFCRAAIATGAIVPPPGREIGSLSTILTWMALGGSLAVLCLLGFVYGLWGH